MIWLIQVTDPVQVEEISIGTADYRSTQYRY